MKKSKTVILYKLGRLQEDFEYLFPEFKIYKYLVDDSRKYHNGIECINFKNLKMPKYLIVICDKKSDELTKKITNANLIEDEDYMYLEDFGKILDEKLTLREKRFNHIYLKKYNIDFYEHDISNSEMFKKMIYTDSTYNISCDNPFKYAQVDVKGLVFPCCPGFAINHLGSLFHKSPKEIWNSKRARLFRLSIINKTYAFCDLNYCKLPESDTNKEKSRINDLVTYEIPFQTVIGFDKTCNLNCKSCRNCNINHNKDKVYSHIYKKFVKKLCRAGWLNKTNRLFLATQGEVFFSKAYQNIIESNKIKGLNSIVLHTNGVLLTPKRLDKCLNHFKKNKVSNISFNISLDSITDKVYENLRPGGNMKILKRNLEYLSKLKQNGKISFVNIIVVLQKANYKELPQIAKYVIDLGFDQLDIQKIMNFGSFTNAEYKEASMYDEFENPKPELVEVLNDPIFKTNKIKFVGNVDLFKNEDYIK